MNIQEIYQSYANLPQQIDHQLKVAAIADLICESIRVPVRRSLVVVACLLHDVANLIKFDLDKTRQMFPGEFTAEQIEYWKGCQKELVGRYGRDEHQASVRIAAELTGDREIVHLVDCVSFELALPNSRSSDFNRKICAYSDMRVAPKGVVSLGERLVDLRLRYDQEGQISAEKATRRNRFETALWKIQDQLFSRSPLAPEEITETVIKSWVGQLKNFDLSGSANYQPT